MSNTTNYNEKALLRYVEGKLFDYGYLLSNNLPEYVERVRIISRAFDLQGAEAVFRANDKQEKTK